MKRTRINQKNLYFFTWLLVFFCGWNFSCLFLRAQNPLKIDIKNKVELGRKGLLLESIESVCEDNMANVYLLDRKACKVFKFSTKGELLLYFGQKGQGPGDFFDASFLAITGEGNIVICQDFTFVQYFNPDGKFIKRIQVPNCLSLSYISNDIFYGWQWTKKGKKQVLVNLEGKIIQSFYETLRSQFSVSSADETGRMVMSNYQAPEYSPIFLFSCVTKHAIIGISNEHKVFLIDSTGVIKKTIQLNRQPDLITPPEREWLGQQINNKMNLHDFAKKAFIKNIPARKNLFGRMMITPTYIFLMGIKKDVRDSQSPIPVDIFNLQGDFIGSSTLPQMPIFMSDQYVYFIAEDLDEFFLLRYSWQVNK